jgi:hypothetical protein
VSMAHRGWVIWSLLTTLVLDCGVSVDCSYLYTQSSERKKKKKKILVSGIYLIGTGRVFINLLLLSALMDREPTVER